MRTRRDGSIYGLTAAAANGVPKTRTAAGVCMIPKTQLHDNALQAR